MANGNCSRCGQPLNGKHKAYCKSCAAEYARENRKNRGEQALEYGRDYLRKFHDEHPEKRAEYHRKSLYGLTKESFDALWTSQNGCCAICDIPLVEGRGGDKLAVDHDHETSAVRGLLWDALDALGVIDAQPWRALANCRGASAELFFTERGESVAEAKAVCRSCPVRDEFLAFALDNREVFGVWGGTSERERRRIRRQRHREQAA